MEGFYRVKWPVNEKITQGIVSCIDSIIICLQQYDIGTLRDQSLSLLFCTIVVVLPPVVLELLERCSLRQMQDPWERFLSSKEKVCLEDKVLINSSF